MIDVIIPAYNCCKTLHKTLSSLEAQTDSNFNVIIVDDCSTEDFTDLLENRKLNIKYIRKEKNEGCGMARQTGIDNSVSEYFTFVDSDDVLLPYTIEVFNYMANSNEEIDIFHSYFYEQGYTDGQPSLVLHKNGYTWCHGKLYKRSFINKFNIKEDIRVKYADDSLFNSQCTELGTYAEIQIPMYLWINNKDSVTRNPNGLFRNEALSDFIQAMIISISHVLEYKDAENIIHLNNTLKFIDYYYENMPMSDEEKLASQIKYEELNKLIRR